MGKNNDSIKINVSGIDCVAFSRPDLIKDLEDNKNGHITIVGRPQLNEWMGNSSVQMVIDDIKIVGYNNLKLSNGNSLEDLI